MRKMWLSLTVLVLASLLLTSSFSLALAQSSELVIRTPEVGNIDEAITIKVTADNQPVEGVSIYAFRPGKGAMTPDMPESRWNIEYSELLGTTNENGELSYTFSQPGLYLLIASKDGYVTGVSRLIVMPSRSLDIEVLDETKIGNAVEIKVTDAAGNAVEGANVYALGRAKAEKLTRWLLGEGFAPAMPLAETEEYDWLIGTSDASGIVTYTFDSPGRYILIATKEGNSPGIARLVIKPAGALRIEAQRRADVGEAVTIKVIERDSGQTVNGAAIYVLSKPPAEAEMGSLKEKMMEIVPGGALQHISSQRMLGWVGGKIAADPDIAIPPELGESIGATDENGEITYTFNEAGKYFLVALKEGYAHGFHPIQVGATAPIEVETSSAVYFPGEIITFRITNNTAEEIYLLNSAPWQIRGIDGAVMFSPVSAQVILSLAPGESQEWSWDQKDSEGNQIPPGKYEVVITSSAGEEYTAAFAIMPSLPTPIEPMPGHPKSVIMERGLSQAMTIFRTEVPAVTAERIYIDGSQMFIDTASGAKAIKMMPDDALRANLRAQKVHRIELKMWHEKPVYQIEGVARAKFFGLIPVNVKVKTLVDADTGQVIKEGKPWWSVFAKMPGAGEVSYEQS